MSITLAYAGLHHGRRKKEARHDAAGCVNPAEKKISTFFRRSCREGVCGSDGLNMNGRMVWPVLLTPISALNQPEG